MIEVNLLPGGRKSTGGGGGFKLSLPKFGGGSLPKGDPWVLGSGAIALVALLGVFWMFSQISGEIDRLEGVEQAALADSVRLAGILERTERLQARRDSIAQRVQVIQQIDGARYVWPHLMDEVARALPDFTWLSRLDQLSPGSLPTFRIEGRAGTIFALTTFMENLEASPFITGVTLIASGQGMVDVGGGVQRPVYQFVLEAAAREAPEELIETVPLFGPDAGVVEMGLLPRPRSVPSEVLAGDRFSEED